MNNRPVYILAAVLCAVGLGVFFLKLAFTGLPVNPGERANAWQFEQQVAFRATGGPVKIVLNVPGNVADKAILNERIVAAGFGTLRASSGDNRRVVLTAREVRGPQVVFYKAMVHKFLTYQRPTPVEAPEPPRVSMSDAQRAAATELLQIALARSADDSSLVSAVILTQGIAQLGDNLRVLAGMAKGPSANADVAVAILATRGIPARRVNGIDLAGSITKAPVLHWLEAFIDGHWQAFSLKSGEARIPPTYLPIWWGAEPLAAVEGAEDVEITLSLGKVEERVLDRVLSGQPGAAHGELMKFSLFGLPLATQHVYRSLMVVPVAIFILVLLRNVIGVKSLGTFMPVLIALALHQTYLLWGTFLFVSIIAAGLLFRLYLEHLKLLLVPRLAAVLIFVVMLMAAISVIMHRLGLEQGLSIALFPMVIITMTIERISVLWDERGASEAIKQGVSSLVIAVFLCILISFETLIYLCFAFPELLLLVLAATLLLGRYTGYRLVELPRFREMAEGKH